METPPFFGFEWELTVTGLIYLATSLKTTSYKCWSGHIEFEDKSGFIVCIKFKVFPDLGDHPTIKIKLQEMKKDNWGAHEETRTHICRLA